MRFAPFSNPFVIVAVADCAADDQQQHLLQGVRHAPRLTRVADDGQMVEQRPKPRLLGARQNGGVHGGGSESRATQPNQTARKPEMPLTRVLSPGWPARPLAWGIPLKNNDLSIN